MPFKPSTSPPQFGSGDALGDYTAGARIGDPAAIAIPDVTNGYTPGVTIEPESFNFYIGQSILDWQTNWTALGTSVADLDAHIIETDSDGLTSIATVDVGGTSHVTTALGAALSVTANTGAGTGSRAALIVADQGRAAEVNNSSTTQPALYVSNDFGAGTGLAFQCQVLDGGRAAEFQALIDPADGVLIDGLGAAKYGARIRASDTGAAILELDRLGVGTPVRGAISLPERARASAPLNGDLWKTPGVSGFSRGSLEWEDAGGTAGLTKGTQRAWSTVGGFGRGFAESTGDTGESATVLATKVTLNIDGTGAQEPNGDYMVEWAAIIRSDDGGNPNVIVQVNGPGGYSNTFHMVMPGNGLRIPFTFRKQFTYAGGSNTWDLKFRTGTNTENVIMSQASIEARGAYE